MFRTLCLRTDPSGASVTRQPVAAVILAGGKSTRMARDKALLPVAGKPMIEHVFAQLQPHFDQILISANDPARFDFLGSVVVPDKIPDLGPLMGIVSCLEASAYDLNFVVACDIPTIDIPFVRRMLRRVKDYDCLVPANDRGQLEPLFAVYRKSALDALWSALAAGQCKISDALARCNTQYVGLPGTVWLDNINTARDYEELLSRPLVAPYALAAQER